MIDAIRRLDAIQTLDESAARANARRHELARENARMRGLIEMVLADLAFARFYANSPECTVSAVASATRLLRMALETESER